MASTDPRLQSAAMLAYGVGSQVGAELPHSRAQESEADHIGLIYMARAGYDPEQAVEFWQRFAAFNKTTGRRNAIWFLRTHPLDEDAHQATQGMDSGGKGEGGGDKGPK